MYLDKLGYNNNFIQDVAHVIRFEMANSRLRCDDHDAMQHAYLPSFNVMVIINIMNGNAVVTSSHGVISAYNPGFITH